MEEKDNNKLAGTRNIKDTVPEEDRPREKAKKHGFGSLSTAELLAILLRVGTPGESVVDLCQRILRDNDDKLYLIARKGINNLVKNYHGIGEVKAIEILAALELARRYQQEEFQERFKITSSDDAYSYLRPRMEHLDHEEILVVLLNHAKQVEECVRISSGGTAMTVADIKMILRPAIESQRPSQSQRAGRPPDRARAPGLQGDGYPAGGPHHRVPRRTLLQLQRPCPPAVITDY